MAFGASPSTVPSRAPLACTANIKQERTGSSSNKNGARAADAVLTADMCPGESEIIANEIDQELARFHLAAVIAPVDRKTAFSCCSPWCPIFFC